MAPIHSVSLAFKCSSKPNERLFCNICSRTLIDFRGKDIHELDDALEFSGEAVCGIFNRSQLRSSFFAAAGATVFAVAGMVLSGNSQDLQINNTEGNGLAGEEWRDDETFFGTIIEKSPQPIGGFEKLYAAIEREMILPAQTKKGEKYFIEFVVDTTGRMTDVKVVRGTEQHVSDEIIRVLGVVDPRFIPGMQRNKPVRTRMVMPVLIGGKK